MASLMSPRKHLVLAASLLWVVVSTPASPGPSSPPTADVTLGQLLTSDPRDSIAACRNVEYGSLTANGRPAALSPNPNGPTTVEILLFVITIDTIDTASNSFRFEGYGGLVWCDPRLAFDPEAEHSEFRVYMEDAAFAQLRATWWPGVVLPTQLGVPDRTNLLLAVFSDGTVRFSMKFNSRMIAQYDFSEFPLDRQVLQIPIQTFGWNRDELRIPERGNRIGFDRSFTIPEWETLGVTSRQEDREGVLRFVTEIEIGRRVGYYLWKILLPLGVFVCVAWSTFWLTRDVLAQRQRQSATAIVSVVAFQFVAAASLPRVSYLTLMDRLFLWTYVCLGLTLITNVLHKRLYRKSEESGLRADRLWRALYPFLYAGGVLLIFLFNRLL